MFTMEQILRIPGPTPIPPSVEREMTKPMLGHRDRSFQDLLASIQPKLRQLFETTQEVQIIAGSGTSGLETAVVNTCSEGDEVAVIVTGSFGERFAKICDTYQLKVHRLEIPFGRAVTIEEVETFLTTHSHVKAVFMTYCETSTSVINPIADITNIIRSKTNALAIVDGVSIIGGAPIQFDAWNVDICVTATQKALMTPPGLTLLAISERAWQAIEENPQPRFYFDLRTYRKKALDCQTPFSPSISLIYGLNEALNLILKEGLYQTYNKHLLMRDMTRIAFQAHQIDLLVKNPQDASPTVTAIQSENISIQKLRNYLKDTFGLIVAGAPGALKETCFRIGHMGHCVPSDVLQYLSLIEVGLHQTGLPIELGKGVQAAQQLFIDRKEGK